ncbi:MAG: hypothetical protein AAF371_11495 [Pseudomonadota bacterium]
MFLKTVLASLAVMALAEAAAAQGLSPMRKDGNTPSDRKGFYLHVHNPYDRVMTFDLRPMELDLETEALSAEARPSRIRIGPKRRRRVVFVFDIPEMAVERKVALCVMPADVRGSILARVCGTYTGRRSAR